MKKGFILAPVVVSSVFFFACEEDAIPVPLPPPPPIAQDTEIPAPAPPPPQNDFVGVASVGPNTDTDFKTATVIQPPSYPVFDIEDANQLKTGRYIIQVAVFPSEASAKALVKKMAVNGINSYYARVDNPAQLLGTYYRVRVGYFNKKSMAEAFARTRLEPNGYAWWIDGRKNDTVGNSVAQKSEDPSLEEAKQAYKEMVKESAKEAAKESVKETTKKKAKKAKES